MVEEEEEAEAAEGDLIGMAAAVEDTTAAALRLRGNCSTLRRLPPVQVSSSSSSVAVCG
jgi:hypothetical protein